MLILLQLQACEQFNGYILLNSFMQTHTSLQFILLSEVEHAQQKGGSDRTSCKCTLDIFRTLKFMVLKHCVF